MISPSVFVVILAINLQAEGVRGFFVFGGKIFYIYFSEARPEKLVSV
jgi:hypothetical protein